MRRAHGGRFATGRGEPDGKARRTGPPVRVREQNSRTSQRDGGRTGVFLNHAVAHMGVGSKIHLNGPGLDTSHTVFQFQERRFQYGVGDRRQNDRDYQSSDGP